MSKAEDDRCSVRNVVHLLGKKWTITIVEQIYSDYGGIHFNGLVSSIDGITPSMLAKELEELNSEGILQKKDVSVNNTVYVNYKLTKKGVLLAELIDRAKEFCISCCPLGSSCKYAYRKKSCPYGENSHPTMISNSRQYK